MQLLFEQALRYLDQGDLEQAQEALEQFITVNPSSMGYNKLGVVHARKQNFAQAKECFALALEYEPDMVPALTNLGNIACEEQDFQLAISYYRKAIEIDPDYSVSHNNLAAVYKQLNQYSEFVKEIKLAKRLEARPKGSRSWRRVFSRFWSKRH